MSETATYLAAGIALCFANTTAWVATWFGLRAPGSSSPLTALTCQFFPSNGSLGLGWTSVGVVAGLAVLAEIFETGAAAMLAKNAGASRRGAAFSMLGALVGSVTGAFLGVPIPVFGSMIGAIVGAAVELSPARGSAKVSSDAACRADRRRKSRRLGTRSRDDWQAARRPRDGHRRDVRLLLLKTRHTRPAEATKLRGLGIL